MNPTLDARAKDGPIRNQIAGAAFGPAASPALKARDAKGPSSDGDGDGAPLLAVAHSLRAGGFNASEDGTGRGTPLVPISFGAQNAAAQGDGVAVGFVPSLDKSKTPAVALQASMIGRTDKAGPQGSGISDDGSCFTLTKTDHHAVAFDLRGREGGAMPEGPHDTANIRAADGGSSRSYVAQPWAVRRLTPEECEALQGFPRGFTRIPYRSKPADKCPDGPRYKALGNSWAVNCADWIAERIAEVDAMESAA